ncbi:uncharacterized protein PFL1_05854 [Pseudozyma flocculosa PF-1]|uniref:Anti-proliferative protein domain-containing protein n=1 Tax=Pseudozyma flocculosa PF-1 TaxID=1277687 RepID=A0A061H1N0_9BASI|nr:uncharacterized protein PFL1_05854 [Pseudozyma flocculosa PF-1]EPQ26532.1 hypothetical protein PFL1_05854 [Pseudozyma flocculosa PF-1]
MFSEVEAAATHIVSLIRSRSQDRDEPISASAIDTFGESLRQQLRARCQSCWYVDEADRGSASRAIAWQAHSAGEGPDRAILSACTAVLESQAEEGEILASTGGAAALDLARRWLPTPFTMWIDPQCVAIRMGSGPGAARSQFDVDSRPSSSSSAVSVVWGKLLAQHGDEQRPAVTVTLTSALPAPERRPVQIVRPESRYPSSLANGGKPQHARNLSTSSCGSSIAGLTRSASISSHGSLSTEATSYFSEDESVGCPSLTSPWSCASSTSNSPRAPSEGEAEHGDETISRTPFRGASLFFGDGDDAGDCTIQADDAADCTLVLEESAEIVSTPRNATHLASRPQRTRTESVCSSINDEGQAKSNYTIHDNGNVGVLGGGVRLGGSRPAAAAPPLGAAAFGGPSHPAVSRHRQHTSSKSVGSVYNPNLIVRDLQKQDPFFAAAATYSAPSHSIPLPPLPLPTPLAYGGHNGSTAPPAFLGQYGSFGGNVPPMLNGPRVGGSSFLCGGGYEPSMLHGLEAGGYGPKQGYGHGHGHGHSASVTFAPSMLGYDHPDCDDASVGGAGTGGETGRRRVRSRGRRSRGRGAGRAARRQAAALKALQEAGDELDGGGLGLDVDGASSDAAFSRCSTPSASEFG